MKFIEQIKVENRKMITYIYDEFIIHIHNSYVYPGLDPAGPFFEFKHPDTRLDKTDADFVDAIHTDTKTLVVKGFGTIQEMGDVDFYPNGGYLQPGCLENQAGKNVLIICKFQMPFFYYKKYGKEICTMNHYIRIAK